MLLDVCEPLPEATLEAGSLLRPAASAESLAAAETRLGRDLPKSFREFLLFSNGANADWDLVTAGWSRQCRTGGEVGVLPTNEVAGAIDAVPEAVEMWTDGWENPNPPQPPANGQAVDHFEPLKEAVLIQQSDTRDRQVLPVPDTNRLPKRDRDVRAVGQGTRGNHEVPDVR